MTNEELMEVLEQVAIELTRRERADPGAIATLANDLSPEVETQDHKMELISSMLYAAAEVQLP